MAHWPLIGFVVLMLAVLPWLMWRLYRWAHNMPKGAYLFMAFFPLISLFPIPTESFKQLDEAKQEQPRPPRTGVMTMTATKNQAPATSCSTNKNSDKDANKKPPCGGFFQARDNYALAASLASWRSCQRLKPSSATMAPSRAKPMSDWVSHT